MQKTTLKVLGALGMLTLVNIDVNGINLSFNEKGKNYNCSTNMKMNVLNTNSNEAFYKETVPFGIMENSYNSDKYEDEDCDKSWSMFPDYPF